MKEYPQLPVRQEKKLVTTVFRGLNRAEVTQDGEMADMHNMTGDLYPILSTRAHRMTPAWPGAEGGGHTALTNPQGMIGTDRLILCDDGRIYVDGQAVEGIELSTEAAMQPKHMVAMGAYVCIWPDKKYINLANPDDYGDMGSRWTASEGNVISAMMCRRDGKNYDMESIEITDTPPAEPFDQQLWLDTSGESDVLKEYSVIYEEWMAVPTTYIKIQATGIGKGIREDDVIHLSGVRAADETQAAEGGETLTFDAEGFSLYSSFSTGYNGSQYISSTATVAERTKVIQVTGVPEGAAISKAVAKFKAGVPMYGAKLLTMNGVAFEPGAEVELPVEVTGDGDVSLLFRFQGGNRATSTGSHGGSVVISELRLEVTWGASGSSANEQDAKQLEALNTTNTVYGAGDDYIIVAGLLHQPLTLANTLVAEMKIPDLDYVCEANNRIWGCSYARVDGVLTNEIRCCALGDFRNWFRLGTNSMDSYVMSIGSDGKFTGAHTVNGYPVFFKEGCLHKVYGDEPASFGNKETACRGVQDGSWRSLAMVGETLYYKSQMDVMAYTGSLPYSVSEKLGHERYYEATGGAYRDKYYLCMRSRDGWHLYVLDTAKGLWHREDDGQFRYMASAGGVLYMAREGDYPALLAVGAAEGTEEGDFEWSVTFGTFGLDVQEQKQISLFDIRAQLEAGAEMTMQIQYDSDGEWHDKGTMSVKALRTCRLPVAPRRCDHCQLRLVGRGDCKIYSIARTYRGGGDGLRGGISRSAKA